MRLIDFAIGSPEHEYIVRAERMIDALRSAASESEIIAAIRFLEDKSVYFNDGEVVGPRGFHATVLEIAEFVLSCSGTEHDGGYWANLACREPDDAVRASMQALEEAVRAIPNVSAIR